MELLLRSSKRDKRQIKIELENFFVDLLKSSSMKNKKRCFQIGKINLLRRLEAKPLLKIKTKKVLKEFQDFLNEFEK